MIRIARQFVRIGLALAASTALCAFAQAPSNEEQQYLLAVVPLIQSGALPEAETRLADGLKKYPRSAILSNALGIVYEREKKPAAAMEAFEHALEWLPTFTAAQIHLGTLYAEAGRCDKALVLFSAAATATADADALGTLGLGAAQCNDYAAAAQYLDRAHTSKPDAAAITYNLALARYQLKQYDQTLDLLASMESGDGGQKPDFFFLRGKAKRAAGRSGAAKDLVKACELDAAGIYCSEAGEELIREEHFPEAAQMLQQQLAKGPPTTAILTTLGLAEFRLGRYRDSAASYQRAVELDKSNDAAWEGLVFLRYMTGDLEAAKDSADRALARPDVDFYLYYLQALVIYRLSRNSADAALASLKQAMAKNAGFAPTYYLRGKIKMDRNDLAGALNDFETATRLDAKYALPLYKMAQIYRRLGRQSDAENAAQRFEALGAMREEEVLSRQTQDVLMPAAK